MDLIYIKKIKTFLSSKKIYINQFFTSHPNLFLSSKYIYILNKRNSSWELELRKHLRHSLSSLDVVNQVFCVFRKRWDPRESSLTLQWSTDTLSLSQESETALTLKMLSYTSRNWNDETDSDEWVRIHRRGRIWCLV